VRFLYPCDPLDGRLPDEAYADEFAAARSAGLDCLVFSLEDLGNGPFRPRPALTPGDRVVYRGWMLDLDQYRQLADAIRASDASLLVDDAAYAQCHHLPNWYERCRDVTPETVFVERSADFASVVAGLGWPGYFVKDYVKSLTTSRGSAARDAAEIEDVVAQIESYRGRIEGGVCIRRYIDLEPGSEARYFVAAGHAIAPDGEVPPLVEQVASRVDSPFFSVDVARAANGELRLIELGDGQVSDRKEWSAEKFVAVLARLVA
jgi:hypothetical protein